MQLSSVNGRTETGHFKIRKNCDLKRTTMTATRENRLMHHANERTDQVTPQTTAGALSALEESMTSIACDGIPQLEQITIQLSGTSVVTMDHIAHFHHHCSMHIPRSVASLHQENPSIQD